MSGVRCNVGFWVNMGEEMNVDVLEQIVEKVVRASSVQAVSSSLWLLLL